MAAMNRLRAHTVWAPDSMPGVQARFRSIFTVLLPLVDLGLIAFGLFGITIGSRIVAGFTLPWFGPTWAACILLAAAVALYGLARQKNEVELGAKIALAVLFLVYAALLIGEVAAGGLNTALTVVIVAVTEFIVSWRIFDLIKVIALNTPKAAA